MSSLLVDDLITAGVLTSPAIIAAFRAVPRAPFLPKEYAAAADRNLPIPIGHGQTNSQPLTVAIMLEKLAPKNGEDVLDVGAGTGWTAALLAHIVGEKGSVTAVELIPELMAVAEHNLHSLGLSDRVECLTGSWEAHLADGVLFHGILVSAAGAGVPARLKLALHEGGRLVIPVEEDVSGDHILVTLTRHGSQYARDELAGFQFVPLV